jgi:hypothetical protein
LTLSAWKKFEVSVGYCELPWITDNGKAAGEASRLKIQHSGKIQASSSKVKVRDVTFVGRMAVALFCEDYLTEEAGA